MIECPIAIKWEIGEEKFAALRNLGGQCLTTEWFEASNIPGVIYRLKIFPSGHLLIHNCETWLHLGIVYGKETQVRADVTFSIDSIGFRQKRCYVKNEPRGVKCCNTAELFFPNYMVDGKLTVKCEGILSVERKSNYAKDVDEKWKMDGLFGSIWNGNSTDFTIVIDGKCIDVSCLIDNGSIGVTIKEMWYNSSFLRSIKLSSLLDLLYFRQCLNPE